MIKNFGPTKLKKFLDMLLKVEGVLQSSKLHGA